MYTNMCVYTCTQIHIIKSIYICIHSLLSLSLSHTHKKTPMTLDGIINLHCIFHFNAVKNIINEKFVFLNGIYLNLV